MMTVAAKKKAKKKAVRPGRPSDLQVPPSERKGSHMTERGTREGIVEHPLVRDYFYDDGSPKKCPKCGSTKIMEKVMGVVDVFCGMGPTCEAEYYCECGECVGFWAYGSWYPEYRQSFNANVEDMP